MSSAPRRIKMKNQLLQRIMIFVVSLLFVFAPRQLFCQGGALLVSSFFAQLNDTIKQLEQSGHSLLDQGNVVAGQQQLVLAATLRATVEQAQSAYKDSLNRTFDQID